MRPSLEATGVDVNDLIKKAFGFELKWYKKGGFPDYQCVVGGILTNEPEKIINELSNYYRINYCAKKDIEDIDMSMVFETNKQLKVPSLIV
jgi:hypothetical protein